MATKTEAEMLALQAKVNAISTQIWTTLNTVVKDAPATGEEAFLHASGAGQGAILFAAEMAAKTQMPKEAFLTFAAQAYEQVKALAG